MRLLHTADWHLGQTLHGQDRSDEHRLFLDWLTRQLVEQRVDVLLIAGDIFDNANPSLRAQQLLYDFIVEASQRRPGLQILMIAGNHDSGARIELPAPLLRSLRTHAIGRIHWLDEGTLDTGHLLVPLGAANGPIEAWCLALPFLRPAEITGLSREGNDDYLQAAAAVHEKLLEQARACVQPGQALIAMSHAHMAGGSLSGDSERNILIGQAEALPAALFPEDICYVALGHLHRPQQIGGQPRICYSGSPLPLSFSEVDYAHRVVLTDIEQGAVSAIQSLPVPRSQSLQRLGPAPLEQIIQQLQALPEAGLEPPPWLEVRVTLEQPQPGLRQHLEQACAGRHCRLIRINAEYHASPRALPLQPLDELSAEQLFSRIWQEKCGHPPQEAVAHDFALLLQRLQQEGAG